MEKLKKALIQYASDLVMIGGAAAIAVGAGMIYPPAGLIAGGGLAILGAVMNALGGGKD